jgi:hypothetical protein
VKSQETGNLIEISPPGTNSSEGTISTAQNIPPHVEHQLLKCNFCSQGTEWGAFGLKLGDLHKTFTFCKACCDQFLLSQTAIFLVVHKLFPELER